MISPLLSDRLFSGVQLLRHANSSTFNDADDVLLFSSQRYRNEPLFQAIFHLGEGTGTFFGNPTLENSAGVFQDISTTAAVMAITLDQLPIGNADIGWKGGELTFTRPGASTPDLRINPCGGSGYPPHYHGRPGIGKHRPWEGGF